MIYIKRVANADITRQIDLTKESGESFFNFYPDIVQQKDVEFISEENGESYSGTLKKTGHTLTITGDIFSLVKRRCEEDDLLIFVSLPKKKDKYNFLIVKKNDPNYTRYDHIISEFGAWSGVKEKNMHLILDFENKENEGKAKDLPLQQIYYGAPGTGKSFEVDRISKDYTTFRTTFHPDSDYSTFVGAYKPTKVKAPKEKYTVDELKLLYKEYKKTANTRPEISFAGRYYEALQGLSKSDWHKVFEGSQDTIINYEIIKGIAAASAYAEAHKKANTPITYEFVPQAFVKAYCEAWKRNSGMFKADVEGNLIDHLDPQEIFLVIEEINRGNCAQIFGDLFQLLDRDERGYSKYPISPDTDLQQYLEEQLSSYLLKVTDSNGKDISEEIRTGKLMMLPSNFHIWATMNTSDQSLFPIDSAFKRRWDWKYVPIDTRKENWAIRLSDAKYSWSSFLENVNKEILDATHSEDKQLGFYFCKANGGEISAETFVSKVLFYIYNDVFKDYGFDREMFNGEDGKLEFRKYYKSFNTIDEEKVRRLLTNLKIEFMGEVAPTDADSDSTENGIAEHKETLVAVTIGGERLTTEGRTQFDLYLETIKRIGADRIGEHMVGMRYHRKGQKMASLNPVEIEGFQWIKEGNYSFLKGMNGYTMTRILEDLNKEMNLGITVEYR